MEALEADIRRRTYAIQSLSHDAEVAGSQTVHSLAQHGEQLDKIKLSLVSVDTTLMDTSRNIGRLKGITRQVIDSVRTKLHQKIFSKVLSHSAIKRNSSSSPATPVRRSSPTTLRASIPSTKSFHQLSTDDTLDQIGNTLQRLKGIALNISDQLDGQTGTIKDIQEHMIRSTISIEQQNTQLKKLFS